MSQLLTVSDTATMLGFTEQYIRQLLREKKLNGRKLGRQWVTTMADIVRYTQMYGVSSKAITNHPTSQHSTKSVKALSFFSGAMGMDLGLEKAGIEVILTSEIEKYARLTIQTNKPNCPLIGDLRDYSADQILRLAGLSSSDEVDLIVGGPPCQAFSTAGRRLGFNDERGNVFLTFINLITDIRPKYAVIENVRGLLSAPLIHRPHDQRGKNYPSLCLEELQGGALLYIIQLLKKAGYGISFNLYNSANFGSPQIRERLVIICNRNGQELPYLEPTHSENKEWELQPWVTFREAVSHLSEDQQEYLPFPEKRLKYYRLLKAGQNWRSLPEELQKEALGKSYYAGGGKTGFLRRINWDKPSPTLVTHPAMPATDLAHPLYDRPLSIQEYKRLQEFPDDWIITGKLLDQYKQIGNAVPLSLGQAIGTLITKHIQGQEIKLYPNFNYSRYRGCDHKTWLSKHKLLTQDKQLELVLN